LLPLSVAPPLSLIMPPSLLPLSAAMFPTIHGFHLGPTPQLSLLVLLALPLPPPLWRYLLSLLPPPLLLLMLTLVMLVLISPLLVIPPPCLRALVPVAVDSIA